MNRCFVGLMLFGTLCCTRAAIGQVGEEHLPGSDRSEHTAAAQEHLFGDWGGARSRLLERGLKLGLLYAGDQLWNLRSRQKERLAVWTRVRGTVDWDIGRNADGPAVSVHATAVWQGGGNLGTYLGTISGPSGIASENTFRLDSWWLERRFLNRHVAFRAGQFAAQDSYGEQFFGASFVFEPFQYGLGNRGAVDESFDPPSTPAAELRVLLPAHTYAKAIVFAADHTPYTHNPTGLVPQFRGAAASAYEVGVVTGNKGSAFKPQDTVESRKGYSGLFRLGSVVNPDSGVSASSAIPVPGSYLIYGSANQALFRTSAGTDQGIDVALSVDWTPPSRTNASQDLNLGLRFNEPLPIRRHNTVGLAWVRSGLSSSYVIASPTSNTFTADHALEANALIDLRRGLLLQPVAQYYLHPGGRDGNIFVLGFHTKVDF